MILFILFILFIMIMILICSSMIGNCDKGEWDYEIKSCFVVKMWLWD